MQNITYAIANFFAGGLMLAIGLILRFVKDSEGLIAGYNTMDDAEKAKWDATAMRLFLGKALLLCSGILLAAGVAAAFGFYPNEAVIVSWGLFAVLILGCVVYMNVSGRFKR